MNLTVDARLEQLERDLAKQRRLTRCLTAVLLGLVSVGVAAGAAAMSQDFDTVTAKKILIKDSSGRVRIELSTSMNESNDAKIAILTSAGNEACVMSQGGDIAGLHIQNTAGDAAAAHLISMPDHATIVARGGGGTGAIQLTASKRDNSITVADLLDKKPEIAISVGNDSPKISATDSKGSPFFLVTQPAPPKAAAAPAATAPPAKPAGVH